MTKELQRQGPTGEDVPQVGVTRDPWTVLRQRTPARIALGRTGVSLPTEALLEFGLAHARARDAVHRPLDVAALGESLAGVGPARPEGPNGSSFCLVHSAAVDRAQYLRRPDLGRALDAPSAQRLDTLRAEAADAPPPQLVLVIADGLSATAVSRHAAPFLHALEPRLQGWRLGPLVVAVGARVALGDEIGERLGAEQVAVLIGERPGLSAADSLGIYLTHAPRVGRHDAERNCLSNIRPEGLGYAEAARRLEGLLIGARRLGRSGVDLKDESEAAPGVLSIGAET